MGPWGDRTRRGGLLPGLITHTSGTPALGRVASSLGCFCAPPVAAAPGRVGGLPPPLWVVVQGKEVACHNVAAVAILGGSLSVPPAALRGNLGIWEVLGTHVHPDQSMALLPFWLKPLLTYW